MEFKEKYLAKQREKTNIMAAPPFPKIIKIDICNTCNYSCIFCPQAKYSKKIGNIDDKLCMKIIVDAYHAGARQICLSSTGEPLLNKNLEKYICLSKSLGYEYIFFNTNGYFMDKKRSESILAAGVDSIKFSINAGSTENYELVHGIDGYTRVIDNLIQLSELRKRDQAECKLYVSYVAVKPTLCEAELLKEKIISYVDDFIVMNANNRGGSISEIEEKLFVGRDDYSYSYPCSQLFHNLYVSAEGYINICCQDFENLTVVADLNEMNIVKAWNSDDFVAFREKYLSGNLSGTLCKNCIYGGNEYVVPLDERKAYFKKDASKIHNLEKRIMLLADKI